MSAKRLDNLLNPNDSGDLAGLIRRARDLDRLTRALIDALPDDQAGSILAANLREDAELVVLAASPAWAARLRFEEESLINAARATGAEVRSCRVRVSRRGEC
jgi:hypothetical protein